MHQQATRTLVPQQGKHHKTSGIRGRTDADHTASGYGNTLQMLDKVGRCNTRSDNLEV